MPSHDASGSPGSDHTAGEPDSDSQEIRNNFVEQQIVSDGESGRFEGKVHARFPPEPNGYLHIGHAKAICLNFGLAERFGGHCNLRFDDTNPTKEETEYVEAIREDVRWLGFDWDAREHFASDYFSQLYEWAERLIGKGKAFVCDLNADELREYRGTLTEPGRDSPFRNRDADENLDLFRQMKAGIFADGSHTLRAKIDMSSPNVNLRDPVMYRIMHASHHRAGNQWCIYPMYDWAHGQSDSIEGITHSVCTLEFENHRPLYDWYLEQLGVHHPRQIEFARLNLTYTMMSKRKLLQLVQDHHVRGWDDPRMPTLSGLRRRGYTPESIRAFTDRIGVSKTNSSIEIGVLEQCLREDLNRRSARVMGVLRPLKLVLTNYPQDQVEEMEAVNNPEDPSMGTRMLPFSRELWIEQDDFQEDPPKKFFRLAPGKEVRLRYGYIIRCDEVIKDEASGEILELHCTYDPETRSGMPQQRKVKGTIHWVSCDHAITAQVRLYHQLFNVPHPDAASDTADWREHLNSESEETLNTCRLEPSLKDAGVGDRFQFERLGYFCLDPDTTSEQLVFNRAVTLRDSWAKIQKQQGKAKS